MPEDSTLSEHASALASERKDRAVAVLGLPELIAGIEVCALTPRRLEWLRVAGNPFVCGGYVTGEAIVQFLWHVSRAFKFPSSEDERKEFAKPFLAMPEADLRDGVDEYIDRAFLDAASGGVEGPSYYAPTIGLYRAIKESYAGDEWTLDKVLDTPLRILHQAIKCADHARGCTLINRRSFAVQAKWIDELETLTAPSRIELLELMELKRGEGYKQCTHSQRSSDGTWALSMRKEGN